MTRRWKNPSFMREVGLGLVLSLAAAAIATTLSFAVPIDILARGIVAALGLAYLLQTLARSTEKTGRVVTVALWVLMAATAWLASWSVPAYLAIHVAMIWLVRSLYAYSRFMEAALDLGLTLLALSFAVWAGVRTESLFLASWCFFLIQAMHVAIPRIVTRMLRPKTPEIANEDFNQGFAAAFNAADEALQRMASRH